MLKSHWASAHLAGLGIKCTAGSLNGKSDPGPCSANQSTLMGDRIPYIEELCGIVLKNRIQILYLGLLRSRAISSATSVSNTTEGQLLEKRR